MSRNSKSPPSSPRSTASSIHTSVSRMGTTASLPAMRSHKLVLKALAGVGSSLPSCGGSIISVKSHSEDEGGDDQPTITGSVDTNSFAPSESKGRRQQHGSVTVLAAEPMRLYPPSTTNPHQLRQWRADVFDAWTMVVERHLLSFVQDIERKLMAAKDLLVEKGLWNRKIRGNLHGGPVRVTLNVEGVVESYQILLSCCLLFIVCSSCRLFRSITCCE